MKKQNYRLFNAGKISMFSIFAMCLVLFFGSKSHAVPTEGYKLLGDYVRKNKEITKLPAGTAVAVIKGDEVVYEGYFGFADIGKKIPVAEDTAFYIASMTKPFFALQTLLDEERQKLNSEWTVEQLFPESDFKPALHTDKVTIRDLLSHTSGIDNWPLVQVTAYTGVYDQSVIDNIISASYVNNNAPLGVFDYTNVGYNILSHWMDSHYPKNWQSRLREGIFSPLNMSHTSALISDAKKNNWALAKGYSVKSDEPLTSVYLRKTDDTMHAAGGLISTARDLANFLIMQVNKGRFNDKQVFPENVITKSQETLVSHNLFGRTQQYGWGWFVRHLFDQKLIEHRGGYSGASTYMSFMPEQQIGLVVLSNQDKWGGDLAYALEDLAYSIALEYPKQDVEKFATENQNRAMEQAKKYYEGKTASRLKPAVSNPAQFTGSYVHETLGNIEVSASNGEGAVLHWGNLRSKLYKGKKANQLLVEFVPSNKEKLVFLTSSDEQIYLQYNDYLFTKTVH